MSEVLMELTQKPPKHWDGLIAICNELTDNAPEITRDIALEVFDAAVSIEDKEEREDVHYFGIGRVTCHFSQLLEEPVMKRDTIESSANALAAAPREARDVLRIKHIMPKVLGRGFDKATIAAEAKLSKGERLLFDVMHGVTDFKVQEQTSPHLSEVAMAVVIRAIIEGGAAREVFRGSVMGGAATLYKDALLLRTGDEESEVTQSEDELRALGEGLLPVGYAWGTRRLDEFNFAKDRVGEQDGRLHAQNIPKELVPAINLMASPHDRRHVCPAIFVRNKNQADGATEGAIHQALRLLPDIIIRTHEIIT